MNVNNETQNIASNIASPLDERVVVTLTRFELKKIRDWNLRRMDAAAHALENMVMRPAKRSRWQVEYDFHARLCDHLHGVDPDQDDVLREHNEQVRARLEAIERQMDELRGVYGDTKRLLVEIQPKNEERYAKVD